MMLFTKYLIKLKHIGRISWKFWYWFNSISSIELDIKRYTLYLSNAPLRLWYEMKLWQLLVWFNPVTELVVEISHCNQLLCNLISMWVPFTGVVGRLVFCSSVVLRAEEWVVCKLHTCDLLTLVGFGVFYVKMNHSEAYLMVSLRVVDFKVFRMAI